MSYALSRPTTARRGGLLGIVIGAHVGVFLIIMAAKTVAPQIMEMPLIVDLIQPAQEKPPEAKPLPVVKPQPVRQQPTPQKPQPVPVIEATQSTQPAPAAPVASPPDVKPAPPAPPAPEPLTQARFDADRERYQTVYASKAGAVAAPTAGLHFDEALLEAIAAKGVERAFVTLHVGAGTFQPVRVERIEEHHMHSEWLEVSPAVVEAVAACKARGGRVIAVGTTSVRSLESAARDGTLRPFSGDTDIFLYPGKPFHVVDALVTNFHLPESTLLMLVSAFAGYPQVMHAYREAVAEGYRFFSYGDAMFITRNPAARGPEQSQ